MFDEIDDQLSPEAREQLTTSQRNRIAELLRRRSTSEWLQDAVSSAVEDELRSTSSTTANIFALLTGNQIERACSAAVTNGDFHLATLLAQAGSDDSFRADLVAQLSKWREYRADAQIDAGYRKIYELLSGNVGHVPAYQPSDPVDGVQELILSAGLDWKRAFALHFWFGGFEQPLYRAIDQYDAAIQSAAHPRLAPSAPLPWYRESPSTASDLTKWKVTSAADDAPVYDAQYELLKLSCGVSDSLETALQPLGFGPTPLDFRLPWHVYMLIARALRVKDFADRVDSDNLEADAELAAELVELEGQNWSASATADELTESYANQLEQLGLWQWSVFVLCHLSYAERYARVG